jgi:hypothetical protein
MAFGGVAVFVHRVAWKEQNPSVFRWRRTPLSIASDRKHKQLDFTANVGDKRVANPKIHQKANI